MSLLSIEYKGTTFYLKPRTTYYGSSHYADVENIEPHTDTIEFPHQLDIYQLDYNGFSRNYSWDAPGKIRQFPGIKHILFQRDVNLMGFHNRHFPDICSVDIIDSDVYTSDGFMVYYKKDHLLRAFANAWSNEPVIIPEYVKEIDSSAFDSSTCEMIIFKNPNIRVNDDAFTNSKWLEDQPNIVVIGDLLFKIKDASICKDIVIPSEVKRFQKNVFAGMHFETIRTHIIPTMLSGLYDTSNSYYRSSTTRELTITGDHTKVNFDHLRKIAQLKAVHFIKHLHYYDIDGVVFSKDQKLMFYPPGKTDVSYTVPDGTRAIWRQAFYQQDHLKKLSMPDSVESIGQGAFAKCQALQSVRLSRVLRELPNASIFNPIGVFEGCKQLTYIEIPDGMKRIGKEAFLWCGLTSIDLKNVEIIGDRAFCCQTLNHVIIPPSVREVGNGAFMYATTITATEGCAKGLVSAIESIPVKSKKDDWNIFWHRCQITMLTKNGEVSILIPESLSVKSAEFIDSAWNDETFDYDSYDEIFNETKSGDDKIELATNAIRDRKDDISMYRDYMRRRASAIAKAMISNQDEDALIRFIQQGYLSESAQDSILRLCTKNSLSQAAAYLLEAKEKHGARRTTAVRI